jgi:hypothetical protein
VYLSVSQVKIAIFKSYVLAGGGRRVDIKRKSEKARAENLNAVSLYLYHSRFDLGVYGLGISFGNLTVYGNYGLLGNAGKHLVVRENDLSNSVMVAKVNEKYSAVISYGIYPSAERYALSDVLSTKLVTGVRS